MAACLSCDIFQLFDAAQVAYGERAYNALWPSIKNAFDVFVGLSLCFYFLRMIATGNAAFSEGLFQFLIYAFCAQTISSSAFLNEWVLDPLRSFMFGGAQLLMTQASVAGFSGDVSGVLRAAEANLLCVVNLGVQMMRDAGMFGVSGTVAAVIMAFPYLVALLLFLLLLAEVLAVLFVVKAIGPMLIAFLAFKPMRSMTRNSGKMLGQVAGAVLISAALMGLMMGMLGTFMKWVPGSCSGGWKNTSGFVWSEGYVGLVLFGYFMLLMLLKAQGWAGQIVEFHGTAAAQMAGTAALGKVAMTAASGALAVVKQLGKFEGSVNPPSQWGRGAGGQGRDGGGAPGLPGPGTPPPSIAPPSSSVKMLGNGPLDWQGPFPTGGGRPSGGPSGGGPMLGGGGFPQLGGRSAALPAPPRALPGPGGTPGPRALSGPGGTPGPGQLGGPAVGPAAPGSAATSPFRQAGAPPMAGAGSVQGAASRGDAATSGASGASPVGGGPAGRSGDMGSRGAEGSGNAGARGENTSNAGPTGPAGTTASAGASGRGTDMASGGAGGLAAAASGTQRADGHNTGRGNAPGAAPTEPGSGTAGQSGRDGAGAPRTLGATGDGGRGFAAPRVAPQGPRAGGGGYGARITNGVGVAEVIPPRGAPVRSQYTRRWR